MTTELITTHDLIIANPLPLDQQPAAVYVAGLAAGSRGEGAKRRAIELLHAPYVQRRLPGAAQPGDLV